jgi:hypothetical protein
MERHGFVKESGDFIPRRSNGDAARKVRHVVTKAVGASLDDEVDALGGRYSNTSSARK